MRVKDIVSILIREDLDFLTGVPCSYLKHLLEYINTHKTSLHHVAAVNEGDAIAIAAGYHLATNKVPIVYLQNSGLGNAVNPLTSLMDKKVYSIPTLLFLTWRGEPGIQDEPQHKKMGAVMLDLLNTLEIPYGFASENIEDTTKEIIRLKNKTLKEQRPVALIFRASLFEKPKNIVDNLYQSNLMTREQVLTLLLPKIGNSPIITTTGKTSREVFEFRERHNQSHKYDFLTVGSMGCVSGIGFGIAQHTKKLVFIIDGDGSVLMRMGMLAVIGYYKPKNFVHIIVDNGSYESTGSQPTVSTVLNWKQLLKGVGYKKVTVVKTKKQIEKISFQASNLPLAMVVYAKPGSRINLGRPTSGPIANKKEFSHFVQQGQAMSPK